MKILINSCERNVADNAIVADICCDNDVVVIDGYSVKHSVKIADGMDIVLVRRGELPSQDILDKIIKSRNGDVVNRAVKNACVAICGLGGLGSNIATMLARLGISRIILIDFDVVEPTNLNRQDYYIGDIGLSKTQATCNRLSNINRDITLISHQIMLNEDNILSYIADADVVVEAFDSPECKAMLVDVVIGSTNKYVVASSGMAGFSSSNNIVTRQVMKRLFVVGDGSSEAAIGNGLMSPRVAINAGHQANMVLRILLGEIKE